MSRLRKHENLSRCQQATLERPVFPFVPLGPVDVFLWSEGANRTEWANVYLTERNKETCQSKCVLHGCQSSSWAFGFILRLSFQLRRSCLIHMEMETKYFQLKCVAHHLIYWGHLHWPKVALQNKKIVRTETNFMITLPVSLWLPLFQPN